jgi:adenylate cyclase
MSAASTVFSFTLIGDTVNTASRLQRLTRSLQTPLVVGHPVIAAANSAIDEIAEIVGRLKDRGEQPLRGRNEPVRIWARPDLSIEE